MIKIMAAIAVLLAAGCAHSQPFSYSADKADPVLIFTSDLYHKTVFNVNFDPSTVNNYSPKSLMSIKNFMYVGYISKYGGPLWFGYFGTPDYPPVKEFTKQVPADQVVVVRAYYQNGYGVYSPICGPLEQPFTPKKGHTYKVNMNYGKLLDRGYCYITITDASDPKSPKIISDSERVRF